MRSTKAGSMVALFVLKQSTKDPPAKHTKIYKFIYIYRQIGDQGRAYLCTVL